MSRQATIERATSETEIDVNLTIDGVGDSKVSTGVGFFDHMLTLFAKHGLFDLKINAKGDLEVDGHHTVEDVGICLGQAFDKALGNREGIVRYGFVIVPMDEALATVSIDISGRPFLAYNLDLSASQVGGFDTDLPHEFFQAFVNNAGITLHVRMQAGTNPHHIIEAVFKGFGKAMDQATRVDPRITGVHSTKGVI
ncbi:MAG: imidazoleglycerol-phosphate dehydratase HisB [Actinomycetota bacterium]|jgi:imidazoleglycerol-phosphate dehydratase|nr:imidazoleglycerol-phosphate dehydratase HisB [Actinomycetota bacterium]MCL6093085.1 imidazoleglycerol-phosphate dehydratase HisB [Actinomycetota bacterium]MDA8167415.1 imidazoleglycerol-phosphate dehydratase HisB [Actinomycetota bacterium]